MANQSNLSLISLLKSFSRAAPLIVILAGCLVLVGWVLDIGVLKSVFPGLVTMKPNTAVAFVLAGVALMLSPDREVGRGTRRIAQGCAATVALIGGLTLSESLFGWDLGIDQLLLEDAPGAVETSLPGRMAPTSAANFLLLGLALLLLDVETRHGRRPAQLFSLVPTLVTLVALIGYAYSVTTFYGIASITEMALHTAILFLLLSLGILFARPEHGLMGIVTGEGAGGDMVRRLLPVTVTLPLVLGWLKSAGERAAFYDPDFGLALFAVSNLVILTVLIWWTANSVNRTDAGRKWAEQELRKLNEGLEQRVVERTAQLEAANRDLIKDIAERERAEQRVAILHDLNLAVTSTLDLRSVLNILLDKVDLLLPSAATSVRLFDRESGNLEPMAFRNVSAAELADHQERRTGKRGLTKIVFETKSPLMLVDARTDPQRSDPELLTRQGLVSYLGVPLIAKGETLGVLSFFTKEAHQFTTEEVEFLSTVAGQAAMAIQNAQLYEQVRAGQEELRTLSHRLAEAQEAERRTISRELHDEIGQALTALKLKLDMSLHFSADNAKAHLKEARSLASELIGRVRRLSLDLRPAMLDDLGLLPTLRWHFERYTALTNVAVDVEQSGLERLFPQEVATAAYRIVQEALTNVARHARASTVGVRLHGNEESLAICIEDQGMGFDLNATLSSCFTSGLSGMRERAFSLGGKLTVESVPGSGTRVTAFLPLSPVKEARTDFERKVEYLRDR